MHLANLLVLLGPLVALTALWFNSERFRNWVATTFVFLRERVVKQHFFITCYIPLILIGLGILYWENFLTWLSGIGLYACWISGWALVLRKRKRNLSKVISCRLGVPASEQGENGLEYSTGHSDGDGKRVLFKGEVIRRTNFNDRQYYMYFRISDRVVTTFRRAKRVLIAVEYYDFNDDEHSEKEFDVQYDSEDTDNPSPCFKESTVTRYQNSGNWALAVFIISDSRFRRCQHDLADFRIRCQVRPAKHKSMVDLYVRSVVVVSLNE